jgi:hypothetical protein
MDNISSDQGEMERNISALLFPWGFSGNTGILKL